MGHGVPGCGAAHGMRTKQNPSPGCYPTTARSAAARRVGLSRPASARWSGLGFQHGRRVLVRHASLRRSVMSSPASRSGSTPATTSATTICARCQTPGVGNFCATCGAPREGARCGGCGSLLTAGAHFCHRCGLAAGAAPSGAVGAGPVGVAGGRGAANALPWAVAAIALLTVIALVAGQRFAAARGGGLDAPSNALPQAGLDDRSGFGPPPMQGGAMRAPDISRMSPEERAARLYDRVIALSEAGKRDSVMFFSPMALTAYQMLDSLTLDQRYDLGRIGEVSGSPELAKAQADTILATSPTHLLGLILASNAASMRGDEAAQRQYLARLRAARASELAKRLPEYEAHRADIDAVK